MNKLPTFFAPMIYLKTLATAIDYYKKAFDALNCGVGPMMTEVYMLQNWKLTAPCFTCTKKFRGSLK